MLKQTSLIFYSCKAIYTRWTLRYGEEIASKMLETTRTKWFDTKGAEHTYIPDLYDIINKVIYEVKPHWKALSETDEMKRKRLAVESSGLTFRYLTDKELYGIK